MLHCQDESAAALCQDPQQQWHACGVCGMPQRSFCCGMLAEALSVTTARLVGFELCTGTASLLLGSTMASGLRFLLDKAAVAVVGVGLELAAASDLLSSLAKSAATNAALLSGSTMASSLLTLLIKLGSFGH